jgi:SWI/SNF-related matrix-associated actin-dependent regulator of chromatin subfamily A member 5
MFWDLGYVTLDSRNLILTKDLKGLSSGQLRGVCVLQEGNPCGRVEGTESVAFAQAAHRPGLPVLPAPPLRTAENTELGSEANKVQREEQRKDEEIGELSVTSTISSRPTKSMGATTSRISPKRWRAKLSKRS